MTYTFSLVLIVFLSCASAPCAAQDTGIYFEKGLSFSQIKEKAAIEGKMIFIDVYTTWCGPCKYMAQKVFTQKKVGDFFNENFINISVQTDTSNKDDENVKSWYTDAKVINEYYSVKAYPTFLFLNAEGELIHSIVGASLDAEEFLVKSQKAVDTASQYAHLKYLFNNGNREPDFLRSLVQAAKEAGDDSSFHAYANTYLATQNDLAAPQNISLITEATKTSQDVGFNILINHPEEVNAFIGNNLRLWILNRIAFDEKIFPTIMPEGKKTEYGGGLVIYGGGKMEKNVNWTLLKEKIAPVYGPLTDQIILNGQLKYYSWSGVDEWKSFNDLLIEYTSNEKQIDTVFINRMALELIRKCDDIPSIREAKKWAYILVRQPCVPAYSGTYGKLLYKSGEKDKAIHLLEQCALSLKSPNDFINETLLKMKTGEQID